MQVLEQNQYFQMILTPKNQYLHAYLKIYFSIHNPDSI